MSSSFHTGPQAEWRCDHRAQHSPAPVLSLACPRAAPAPVPRPGPCAPQCPGLRLREGRKRLLEEERCEASHSTPSPVSYSVGPSEPRREARECPWIPRLLPVGSCSFRGKEKEQAQGGTRPPPGPRKPAARPSRLLRPWLQAIRFGFPRTRVTVPQPRGDINRKTVP